MRDRKKEKRSSLELQKTQNAANTCTDFVQLPSDLLYSSLQRVDLSRGSWICSLTFFWGLFSLSVFFLTLQDADANF